MSDVSCQIAALHEVMRANDSLYSKIESELKDKGYIEVINVFSVARESRSDISRLLKLTEEEGKKEGGRDENRQKKEKTASPFVEEAKLRHAIHILLRSTNNNKQSLPFNDKFSVLNDWLRERKGFDQLKSIDAFNPRSKIPEYVMNIAVKKLPVKGVNELIDLLKKADEDENKLTEEEVKNLEILHLIEQMEINYRKELDRLAFYGLVDKNTSPIPTFNEVMTAFSWVDLMNVIECKFQEPKLLLTPPIPLRLDGESDEYSLEKAINKKYQTEVYIANETYDNSSPGQWNAFVVEGAIEIDVRNEKSNLKKNESMPYLEKTWLKVRVNNFINNLPEGVRGVDRWQYAHLMMVSLKDNKPIDQENSTLLPHDPAYNLNTSTFIPFAYYENFRFAPLENPGFSARFRRSVGGNIQRS